jgi:hypothetical protein
MLFIWENIESDMLSQAVDTIAMPTAGLGA